MLLLPPTEQDIIIRYGGQQHQIDANVFVGSLIHMSAVLQEVNREMQTGKPIKIKINALEKGSFMVHLEVEQTLKGIMNLLSSQEVANAAGVVSAFIGLIGLYVTLKGKKPEKAEVNGDDVVIVDGDNNQITVNKTIYNIYSDNTRAREAIASNFAQLRDDPSIESFELSQDGKKPQVVVPQSDFSSLSIKSEFQEDGNKQTTVQAHLTVVKAAFEDNLKWEFYYLGNKITAQITDPDFQLKINNGEPFAKGDRLEADLVITQKFDETVRLWVNKSYKVNKVYSHNRRPEQGEMDFDGTEL